MTNKPIDSNWTKIREQFKTGLFASILVSFACLIWPGYKSKISEKDFLNETRILKEKPIFKKERKGKNTSYFINLVFSGDNQTYKIDGISYEFLNHKEFTKDLNSGDTVSISRYEKSIKYLSKGKKKYLHYKRAETNRSNTILFLGLLFLPIIPICIIILILKKRPTYQSGENISLQSIVITTLVVAFIILKMIIDFEFITNGGFVN